MSSTGAVAGLMRVRCRFPSIRSTLGCPWFLQELCWSYPAMGRKLCTNPGDRGGASEKEPGLGQLCHSSGNRNQRWHFA